MYLQKVKSKNLGFFGVLKVNDENSRIRSASGPGSISQRYGYHLHLVLMSLERSRWARSFLWIQFRNNFLIRIVLIAFLIKTFLKDVFYITQKIFSNM
jgi:hypothetical protein